MKNIKTLIIEETEITISFLKNETIPPKLEITRLISCVEIIEEINKKILNTIIQEIAEKEGIDAEKLNMNQNVIIERYTNFQEYLKFIPDIIFVKFILPRKQDTAIVSNKRNNRAKTIKDTRRSAVESLEIAISFLKKEEIPEGLEITHLRICRNIMIEAKQEIWNFITQEIAEKEGHFINPYNRSIIKRYTNFKKYLKYIPDSEVNTIIKKLVTPHPNLKKKSLLLFSLVIFIIGIFLVFLFIYCRT